MKFIKKIPLLIFVSILLIPLGSARADAAPPMNPPGGNVSPEGQTQVEMLAEQVIIDFRQSGNDTANVTAWFLFRNTGTVDEQLAVRFPLNGDEIAGVPAIPYIKDFAAWIGNQQLPTQTIKDNDINAAKYFLGYQSIMYWAVFEMDFPVGIDVKLTVKYTARMSSWQYDSRGKIFYILATGAGWKNSIGSVDVIMRFPYIVNELNFPYLESEPKLTVIENEIRFHKDNLEPTSRDNIELVVAKPQLWQDVLQNRLNVIATPDDASAWLNLAHAYSAVGRESHGCFMSEEYRHLYTLAFQRVLALNPNDANLHAEFAKGLLESCTDYGKHPDYAAVIRNEIAISLDLDPQNQVALDLIEFIKTYRSDFPLTIAGIPSPTSVLPTTSPTPKYSSPTPLPWPTPRQKTPTPALPSPTPVEPTELKTDGFSSTLISFIFGVGVCLIGVFFYNRVIRKK